MKGIIKIKKFFNLWMIMIIGLFFNSVNNADAQRPIIGTYRLQSQTLTIKPDSNFSFEVNGGMYYCWNQGKWYLNGDTLFLKAIPVIDTIKVLTKNGLLIAEHRIYSSDTVCDTYKIFNTNPDSTEIEIQKRKCNFSFQRRCEVPSKLIRIRKKLYEFDDNGRPIKFLKLGKFSIRRINMGYVLEKPL
jgi:hypothetical protein